jgi:hypothetical protein
MKRTYLSLARIALVPLLLGLGAAPAGAVPGGYLRVLLKGYWICEAQGDAASAPTQLLQDSFRVIADSSYRTNTGATGSYLLLGTDLVMTGGPFRGRRYLLVGQGILHPLDAAGKRTTNRCVRQGTAGTLGEDSGDPGEN